MAALADLEDRRRQALVRKLTADAIGALDLISVYIGDRLGLYRVLAEHKGATPAELASAAELHPRYVREWLEQQTVSGIIETDNPEATDEERRYRLPPGHDEALLNESSLDFMASLAQGVVSCTRPLQTLLDAFRTGAGVPYAAYGSDASESQARSTRALYERLLTSEWLPAIPHLHQRLQADPPTRIADVACGYGHSTLALARGYPKVLIDGIDLDGPSIAAARALLAESGLEHRVAFRHRDAGDPDLSSRYDLVTLFEALHDMPYPVDVLKRMRGMLVDGGCVLVADERTAERFSPDADDTERLHYGFSVLHCLPVGMVGNNAAGTGTVMRPDTMQRYAAEAGFKGFEIQPIEDKLWRFYLLTEQPGSCSCFARPDGICSAAQPHIGPAGEHFRMHHVRTRGVSSSWTAAASVRCAASERADALRQDAAGSTRPGKQPNRRSMSDLGWR